MGSLSMREIETERNDQRTAMLWAMLASPLLPGHKKEGKEYSGDVCRRAAASEGGQVPPQQHRWQVALHSRSSRAQLALGSEKSSPIGWVQRHCSSSGTGWGQAVHTPGSPAS